MDEVRNKLNEIESALRAVADGIVASKRTGYQVTPFKMIELAEKVQEVQQLLFEEQK